MLNKLGIKAQSVIASEFEDYLIVDEGTFIIALSQSGETMDVITPLKHCKKKDVKIGSIVNVPFSTIHRWSEISLNIVAGKEICVASTKSFTNQVIALLAIAKELGLDVNLKKIPEKLIYTIQSTEEKAKKIAHNIYKKNDLFVLGKGVTYPIAREFALKIKEIAYLHAEGMMAGELKHGTIALIEPGVPVISLIPNGNYDIISSTREVQARGAETLIVTNAKAKDPNSLKNIEVPNSSDYEFALYATTFGFLLSYYIALERGCEIDKPRNLAKSVTVK